MKLRFLQQTESDAPGFPFVQGQVIEVSVLTPEMERWLVPTDGRLPHAELVREQEPEVAVAFAGGEAAVVRAGKKKKPRGY